MGPTFHFDLSYKYCSADTLPLIVESGKLRFSRADTFNDIFELSPLLLPLNWGELVELKESNPEAANACAEKAYRRVCASLYITCFSKHYKSPESQLMWAHYADNHKGCCICVDFSSLRGNPDAGSLYPVEVEYVDSLLDERNKRRPDSSDLGMLIGATKQNVWKYEQEVRLVLESENFDSDKFEYVNNQQNVDVDFSPTAISKVIFGLKSSSEDIKTVVKAFCDVGHIPEFTRLDIDPMTLNVVEKDDPFRDLNFTHTAST